MAYIKKPGGYAKTRPSYGAKRPAFGEPTERFQAICNECHKTCEVPFRPNGKKPVYCRDCFKSQEEIPSYGARSSHRDSAPHNPDFAKRLDAIDGKLDRILKSLGK